MLCGQVAFPLAALHCGVLESSFNPQWQLCIDGCWKGASPHTSARPTNVQVPAFLDATMLLLQRRVLLPAQHAWSDCEQGSATSEVHLHCRFVWCRFVWCRFVWCNNAIPNFLVGESCLPTAPVRLLLQGLPARMCCWGVAQKVSSVCDGDVWTVLPEHVSISDDAVKENDLITHTAAPLKGTRSTHPHRTQIWLQLSPPHGDCCLAGPLVLGTALSGYSKEPPTK